VAAWRRHFEAGLAALEAGRPAAARDAFDDALAVSDLHADTHFARGRALDAIGRQADARDAYLRAKDRDELRFRAPEEINAILRRVASEEGATVVEVQQALVAAAEDGSIGQDLMLEHLHPNVDGYFELADAYYEALRAAGIGGTWEHPVDREAAHREMPLTTVDVLYGLYRARSLTAGWPFRDGGVEYRPPRPRNEVEEIAQGLWRGRLPWPDAMRDLLDHHRTEGEVEAAAKVAALLADAFPHRAADQRVAAELLRRAGRPDAEVYRRRVLNAEATGAPR
jgi:tetratricopeptide (TPR) repeat protein